MLSLSQTTGYAILALGCLQESKCGWVKSAEIARYTGIPVAYLSKILHQIGHSGLITTRRGTYGGFALSRPASRISLYDVIVAVEGPQERPSCLLGLSECSDENPCPAHTLWKTERGRIEQLWQNTKLSDVAEFARGGVCLTEARCACGRSMRSRIGVHRQHEKETA
ncbi:MAG: Rrf2 family transcriptional regulator [Planctomycetes bacterium]|nr:Rrf2 family transcriptional regulator [Planctomycetota bacterium]NOG55930.1 Rrf2 family transcriptional regulator [Planctomycetota bacterium]